MNSIQEWVNNTLLSTGLSEKVANQLDNFIVLAIIIGIAIIVNYICRSIILGTFKRIAQRTKNTWDDLLIDRKIINKLIHIIPGVLVYILLPFAFSDTETPFMLDISQRVCMIYIIAVVLRFINASLKVAGELYHYKDSLKDKPLKGFIQVIQVAVLFIGAIVIIAILINQSPKALFAGLGASTAVLMLVFKDSILGFVAGIQLSANNMLRPGDWITINKYGADGWVTEVTLNAIKVRNFDNTVTTIPPYALVSDSFQNWRNMFESGGRRIKRSIHIDMNTVTFCTPEMLEKFRKISLISDYIDEKEKELETYNKEHQIDSSILVNGRRQTNLGVFRAYLLRYLEHHPQISKELIYMVRQLQPTEKGIPMEVYCFSSNKEWVTYEGIQADVFDHILAIMPEFGLKVFQSISGNDLHHMNIHLEP